ncbi:MAG: methionyl-tRNA formyltransferase [Candidatus Liptonbacteria bacterium]|nr:methionyl-tRNA formyltransferase [Candidatus Liptonbacteria bacterium]
MKYVFFGTPEFAAIVLERLIGAGMPPATVVCNPDRPVGRKKVITPPPTKLLAQKYNIPVLQPEVLSTSNLQLLTSNCDFFVVAAYAKILPREIIELPRLGTIGVHPSLLPKYRGTTPIQSAILAGDEETGVALYCMDEKVDHGAIIAKSKAQMANSNYEMLLKKLAALGGNLLIQTLPKFVKGEIRPVPQDESQATYTKKFATEDACVGEKDIEDAQAGDAEKAIKIDRMIRALNPEPGVWTFGSALANRPPALTPTRFESPAGQDVVSGRRSESGRSSMRSRAGKSQIAGGKRVKLLEAEIRDGKLLLKKIQVEGKTSQTLS